MFASLTKEFQLIQRQTLRSGGMKLLFHYYHHDPYYEFTEKHTSKNYNSLQDRLASQYLFNANETPLSFSAVTQCSTILSEKSNLKQANLFESELVVKNKVMEMMKLEMDVPFVSTNGCIANYRNVLDFLLLSGISRNVLIPRPSDNRLKECLFRSKIDFDEYRFFNYRSGLFNFGGMLEDFYQSPCGSCFFVDLGVQYPTGCTIHENHWKEIIDCCKQRDLQLWLNLSLGGLGSKSIEEDLKPIQHCVANSIPCVVSIDFSSSLGLLSESSGLGCIFVFNNKAEQNLLYNGMHASQTELNMFSLLLSNQENKQLWDEELEKSRMQFAQIRKLIKLGMSSNESIPHSQIQFLYQQCGPFTTIPLSKASIIEKRKELGVFIREDGFLNFSGVCDADIQTICNLLQSLLKRQ